MSPGQVPHMRADQLLRAILSQGFTVDRTSDGWMVRKGGRSFGFHTSTLDAGSRSYQNVLAGLRGIGFDPRLAERRDEKERRRRLLEDRERGDRAIAQAERKMRMEEAQRPVADVIPCGVGNCDRTFDRPQAAGLHRRRAHGIKGPSPDAVRRRKELVEAPEGKMMAGGTPTAGPVRVRQVIAVPEVQRRPDLVTRMLTLAEQVEALVKERDELREKVKQFEELKALIDKLS